MKSRFLFAIVLAAVSLLLGKSLSAVAEENSWTGENALPTKPVKDIVFHVQTEGAIVSFPLSDLWLFHVRQDRKGQLRMHDGHDEGWVNKADFVLAKEAPAFFDKRLAANPKDIFALHMHGLGCVELREWDKALKDFDECIRLNPNDSAVFISRVRVWRE